MKRAILACIGGLLLSCAPAGPPVADSPVAGMDTGRTAKFAFGAAPEGSNQRPTPIGEYAGGCLAGGTQLAETGPTWQAMRLDRNRNWAHPRTVDFVQDLSRRAANLPGWEGLYVGDMSQPRGGPMLSGHRSHQSGLDADIWLRRADRLNLSRDRRENISSTSLRRQSGAFVNENWTPAHGELIKMAAEDPRVARIFVFPGAKVRMCETETGNRDYLRKIRPWWGHHYHFHVRLACPAGADGCVDQAPPPPGDGCNEAQEWVQNILNPAPVAVDPDPAPAPATPRETRIADLPQSCQGVLAAGP